ncbi:MAG: flippase-like domain-containing protein [Syntrophobacteraceae bacterium]
MSAFRISSRVTKTAAFLLGAGLLAWLVVSSGISSILADLSRVGPGLLAIVALDFVIDAFSTLGWWFTLPVAERSGTYNRLYWVRCAGSALNESTPAGSVGGEPVKVLLLRGRISAPAATASLLATKVTFCFSTAIFIIVGMAVVWPRLSLPWDISLALLLAFILMLTGVTIFTVLQLRGIGGGTVRFLRRLRIPDRWLTLIESSSHEVDAHLSDFYRGRPGDAIRSVGAHFCGFGCATIQILLMMVWLGLGFDPIAAVGIEAFSTLIAFVAFAVPASLGVQEGGKVLIFWGLGLPRSAAMALGIAFRLTSLFKIAVGLVVFVMLQHRLPDLPDPTEG